MPGILDSISTRRRIIAGLFKAAEKEGEQVEKHGLLAACADLDAKLHDAYGPFHDALQEVIDEMQIRVTKKVVNNKNNNRRNKS